MKGKAKQLGLFATKELTPEAERLLANWEVVAGAAGGIANLRRVVLHLAFQGRLTTRRIAKSRVINTSGEDAATMRGRVATTDIIPGISALSVGPAEMRIPAGWQWVPLTSVAALESGHTPSRNHPEYWNGDVPWIGIKDARKHHSKEIFATEQTISNLGLQNSSARLLPKGTVCLSRTASVGYVTVMGQSMATSQDFVNWVCSDRLLPKFLMYLFICEHESLRRFSKGAVHQTIYFPEVKAFHIALPPVAEQHDVVLVVEHFLRLCDDLEARQAKQRGTVARLNKAALDALTSAEGPDELAASWGRVADQAEALFANPESVKELRGAICELAVRGRLVAQAAGDEPAVTLLAKIAAIKSRAVSKARARSLSDEDYVNSIPYDAPSQWEWRRLDDLALAVQYGTSERPHEQPIGVPILRMSNLRDGKLVVDDLKYVPLEADGVADLMLQEGDLLFNRTNSYELVGKAAVFARAPHLAGNCVFASYLIRVVLAKEFILPEFVNMYFGTLICRKTQIEPGVTQQTGQANFSGGKLRNVWVPVPPLTEQKRIVAKVDQLVALCDTLEQKLRQHEDSARKVADALVAELLA